ncbi:MAG TPA: sporulation integral membrane protein YtvI [Verrucomicrobiae bacterium]|nr:sporulation integral membrane protein YtvI [Verrucomicrobiae bacterium]
MKPNRKNYLGINLNRLVIAATILVGLKVFTYFFEAFLPVFKTVVGQLTAALLPFLIALLLAFLLEPVVRLVSAKMRIKRGYASFVVLLLVYFVFGFLLFALINRLQMELTIMATSFPSYNEIVTYLSEKIHAVQQFVDLNPKVKESLYSSTQGLFTVLQDWASGTSMFLLRVLAALPKTFAVILLATIATYFISADYLRVTEFIKSLFPKVWQLKVQAVSRDLGAAANGFLKAQATLIGITMFLTILGLVILGVEVAFTVGVLTGLLDILPVVGTGMLFVPWILWMLVSGQSLFALKLAIVYGVILGVRQFLEPKVLSKNLGLDPLPTLISMYVGAKLLGGWGLLLGPTLVIVYQALAKAGVFHKPRE